MDTKQPTVGLYRVGPAVVRSELPLPTACLALDGGLPPSAPRIDVVRAWDELPPLGRLTRTVGEKAVNGHAFRTYQSVDAMQWDVRGVGSFRICAAGRVVRVAPAPGAAPGDIEHVLLGPVLTSALQLLGTTVLHAAAVVVDGEAVAFTAPGGTGKSTLAAFLGQRGFSILSDDVLPVRTDDVVAALPSIPRLKLWDDSLRALGDDPENYVACLSWLEKRQLHLDNDWGGVPADRSFPLRALYLLEPHNGASPPAVQATGPAAAALAVLGAFYLAELLSGDSAATALSTATHIAAHVPVRRLSYPRRFEALPALVGAVLADLALL